MEREMAQHSYDMMLLMLTDVLKEGTLLIAVGNLDVLEHAFNVSFKQNAAFLPGVISRKKQIVPALSLLWG
jgi:manganese-dependent inorganic pyrophosphatase